VAGRGADRGDAHARADAGILQRSGDGPRRDTIDEGRLAPEDQRLFQAVADLLKGARLSKSVELHQRQIVVLESVKGRPSARRSSKSRHKR